MTKQCEMIQKAQDNNDRKPAAMYEHVSIVCCLTCISTRGWPKTTMSACARVIATLNRLGFLKKPTVGSDAPPGGIKTEPLGALPPGGRSAGLDRTVEMKMMRASCPWKSSTVPTRTAASSRARSNRRSFFTCTQHQALLSSAAEHSCAKARLACTLCHGCGRRSLASCMLWALQ